MNKDPEPRRQCQPWRRSPWPIFCKSNAQSCSLCRVGCNAVASRRSASCGTDTDLRFFAVQKVGVGAASRASWRRRHSSRAPPRSTLAAGTEGGLVTCGGHWITTTPRLAPSGSGRSGSLEGRRARPQPAHGIASRFTCADARVEHCYAGIYCYSQPAKCGTSA